MTVELKVGSKGEIFLPKSLREKHNISPGTEFTLTIQGDQWILTKRYSLEELLSLSPLTEPQSYEEIKKDIREEQERQFKSSTGE